MQKRRLLFEKCLIHLASLNLIKTAEGKAISLKQSSRMNWWIEFERLNIPIKIKTEKKGSASMMMNNSRLWKLDKQNVKKKKEKLGFLSPPASFQHIDVYLCREYNIFLPVHFGTSQRKKESHCTCLQEIKHVFLN